MRLSFQPVTLGCTAPDRSATLVSRDGRLLAARSCSSNMSGTWLVEAASSDIPRRQPQHFATLAQFAQWIAA